MIDSYAGQNGITINVENSNELYHALGIIRDQVGDNIGKNGLEFELVLSRAMDIVLKLDDTIDTSGF